MYGLEILLTLSFLIVSSKTLNFKNNACNTLLEYPTSFLSTSKCYENPNGEKRMPDLVTLNGYQVQTYHTVSSDGYNLTIFRIPPTQNDTKQVIYLQHGVSTDSSSWTITGNQSLVFYLADQGYDVWMGNNRETIYSRKHKTLSPTESKYWDFTLHDLKEDVRTSVDFIFKKTKQPMIYLGHSQGTTLGFMYAAEYPEEATLKLKGIVALAPIVYLNLDLYAVPIVTLAPLLFNMLEIFKINVLFSHTQFIQFMIQQSCRPFPLICRELLNVVFGETNHFAAKDLLLIYHACPSGVAVKQLTHFRQIYRARRFQKFDFGEETNLEKYGQKQPPLYDLGKIEMPTFLFYGATDILTGEEGQKKLLDGLGSKRKDLIRVPINGTKDDQFNHINFIMSPDIKPLFYQYLLSYLHKEFSNNQTN